MRRAPNVHFIENGSGKLCGVRLEADFVSEHEMGIGKIENAFAIPYDNIEKYPGIERRSVKCLPGDHAFRFVDWGEKALLFYTDMLDIWYGGFMGRDEERIADIEKSFESYKNWKDRKYFDEAIPYKLTGEYTGLSDDGLCGAWDGSGFCVFGYGKQAVKYLKDIYEAITKKNAAIFLGKSSNNPFENAGLNVMILSALPHDFIDMMKDSDLDHIALMEAHHKSDITNKLKKAFKEHGTESKFGVDYMRQGNYSFWMALSPAWQDKDDHSKGIQWWLNPQNQKDNNFGWYNEEQLMLWPEGKGPVPMTEEQKAKKGRY